MTSLYLKNNNIIFNLSGIGTSGTKNITLVGSAGSLTFYSTDNSSSVNIININKIASGSNNTITFTGSDIASSALLTNLSAPNNATDATNKTYVDQFRNQVSGSNSLVQINYNGSFGSNANFSYNGSSLFLYNTTASTNQTTGAHVISGGLGVVGTSYLGTVNTLLVTGLAAPNNATDATNKTYVDQFRNQVSGSNSLVQLNYNGSFGSNANFSYNGSSLFLYNTTVSTNQTTGSLIITGGIGITGTSYLGTVNTLLLTTDAINPIQNTDPINMYTNSSGTNSSLTLATGISTSNICAASTTALQTSVLSSWSNIATNGTSVWSCVTHGYSGGSSGTSNILTIVAVGTGPRLVTTSTDGQLWTSGTGSSMQNWTSVCWASTPSSTGASFIPIGGSFVAVSSTGLSMTSSDGIVWTSRVTGTTAPMTSVAYGGGLVVSVSSNGSWMRSTSNGLTWTTAPTSVGANLSWSSVCYSPALARFVSVASTNNTGSIMVSNDGSNSWTQQFVPALRSWKSICWSENLGLFVGVASGTQNPLIMTSNNTNNYWLGVNAPSLQNWSSVTWSDQQMMFVAIASNGATSVQIMSSPDGITWSNASSISASAWSSIDFVPDTLQQFIAVGQTTSSTSNMMVTTSAFKLSSYNQNLTIGTTGTSKVRIQGSDVVVYNIPFYYRETTVTRNYRVPANAYFTDLTIDNVLNGAYMCYIWFFSILKGGVAASTESLRIMGSHSGIINTYPNGAASSFISNSVTTGNSTGSKSFSFLINSNSVLGFQSISYQLSCSTGGATCFQAGWTRTMYLQRIG